MLIISRTPVRISFFGGGTDYPSFYQTNEKGGAVLGTTIDKYVYISVKTIKSAFFPHAIRVAYSKIELVQDIDQLEHPSIRECLKHKNLKGNLDVNIIADLPAKTGFGSSSACTVSFLNALYALKGRQIDKQSLAEEAIHIEQNLIRENVGSQDQFHAAYGGFNIFEFNKAGIKATPLELTKERIDLLQDQLLVFFTGMTRFASAIVKEQIERTEKRINDHILSQMYQMVFDAKQIMVNAPKDQMVLEIGKLLNESWQMKKSLSNRISNPKIDEAYDAAIRAGAYGGKLCGAGNGGFLAFFVSPEKKQAVRDALKDLNEVEFRFENSGSSIIYTHE